MPQPLNEKQSIYYGSYAPLADVVVIDTAFPEGYSKYITVGVGGDVVFENGAGELQLIKGVVGGSILPIIASKIVSSGTVRGTARTTTASDMGWLGGY